MPFFFAYRPIYLFVMHLATRQIVHFNVTRNPTGTWTAQQMREISPWGEGPRFLICDNDALFGETFEEAAAGAGTEIIHTPLYTPQANGQCERLIKSIKHECLDHMLIFHEQQLRRVMKEYTAYYHAQRPHQGIGQRVPIHFYEGAVVAERNDRDTLLVTPFLNGLHHSYTWASASN